MTTPVVDLNLEGAFYEWLKDHEDFQSPLVWFYYELPSTPQLPAITVARFGGGFARGDAPLHEARLSFSVWAKNKLDAVNTKRKLVDILYNITDVYLDDETFVRNVTDISEIYRVPTNNLRQYVVDVTVRATTKS